MEFCEVDGLRIDTAGPYTLYPSGQIPWAGERPNPTAEAEDFARHRRSWRGDLVINVAGARAGDPSVTASARSAGAGREATTKATPSGEADDDDANHQPAKRPLIIRPGAAALDDPNLVEEFRALRHCLIGQVVADPKKLAELGIDPAAWNDLVVFDPDGNSVALVPDDEEHLPSSFP